MRSAALIVFMLFLACGRPVEQESSESQDSSKLSLSTADSTAWLITCKGIGNIKLTDDMASLITKVGAENISTDSLFLEGNFERMTTKVFKGTPREVIVHWEEQEEPFQTINELEIAHRESVYHFSNGIGIGTSLKKVVDFNGGVPIALYGFGWDYGGTFISFRNGKLAEALPCFGGVFQLSSTDIATPELKKIMGDHEIHSDAEALKEYQAALVKIRIKRKESNQDSQASRR